MCHKHCRHSDDHTNTALWRTEHEMWKKCHNEIRFGKIMSYRWSDLVDSESFGMSPGGRNIEIPRPLIIHYSMSKRDAHKIKTSPLQEKILIFFQAISVSWSVRKTTWQYWADDESPENKRNAPIASAKTTMRNSQVYVVIFHFSGLRLRLICLDLFKEHIYDVCHSTLERALHEISEMEAWLTVF